MKIVQTCDELVLHSSMACGVSPEEEAALDHTVDEME
jgi:hypothetical protein